MYSRRPRKAVHACRKGVVLGQWHRNLCCFWSLREQASGSQVSRESASGCEVLQLCVSSNGEHSICIISWVRGACGMLWVWILFWDALLTRLYYTQCLSWVESFVVLTEVLLCADVLCCFVDASCSTEGESAQWLYNMLPTLMDPHDFLQYLHKTLYRTTTQTSNHASFMTMTHWQHSTFLL